jgi:hypothetical protein
MEVKEVINTLEQAPENDPSTSQFTSKELNRWAYANNITLDFSRLGKLADSTTSKTPYGAT